MRGAVDANQSEIVEQLRALGMSVWITSSLGKGFPDIVVGCRGKDYMFEIKDPKKAPNKRRLTKDEFIVHSKWKGHLAVIHSVEEALKEMGM